MCTYHGSFGGRSSPVPTGGCGVCSVQHAACRRQQQRRRRCCRWRPASAAGTPPAPPSVRPIACLLALALHLRLDCYPLASTAAAAGMMPLLLLLLLPAYAYATPLNCLKRQTECPMLPELIFVKILFIVAAFFLLASSPCLTAVAWLYIDQASVRHPLPPPPPPPFLPTCPLFSFSIFDEFC